MNLTQAIAAAGMTPPREIHPGRWLRFPGIGKGRANRAGWCRVISPTLAIYGDWSSGLTATWKDDAHRDDATTQRLLAEARTRERAFQTQQRERQARAGELARELIRQAKLDTHPYLAAKGFPELRGLLNSDELIVPMRDVRDYRRVLGVQRIAPDGAKRFLSGARASGAIHRLGAEPARRVVLCEGYATGLTIQAAISRLPGPHAVIVCFSAGNLVEVAPHFTTAQVAADHDESGIGEKAARDTGLSWAMPPELGDWNDWHQQHGLHAVTEALRAIT